MQGMKRSIRGLGTLVVFAPVLVAWGCLNRPSRIHPPGINASAAGKRAIEQYDTDGDGMIGGAELQKAGAINSALKKLDSNGDGKVSAEEITTRVQVWKDSKVGRMLLSCAVRFKGKPLEGATVTFVPEEFLGGEIKAATGTSDKNGMVSLTIPDVDPPGVACGLYRVEVSKQVGGQETIPPIYNSQTILGQEVAMEAMGRDGIIVFNLK